MTRNSRRQNARKTEKGDSQRRLSVATPALPSVHAWIVVAIVITTVLAYAPALSAPFVMDDVPAIVDNASIKRLFPPNSAFAPPPDLAVSGRPVVNVTLGVNYAINQVLGVDQRRDPDGPSKTIGYHLLNIAFHLCTGALLFGVMRRLLREDPIPEDWQRIADPFAAVVCTLWLLHPIQTEAINYVVQRTELLASLFYVGTLYSSLRAWEAPTDRSRKWWYAAGLLSVFLAISSKEIAISVPIIVMLYDRAFKLQSWRAIRHPGRGRGWFYLGMGLVCGVTFVALAAGARGGSAGFGTGMKWYGYFYTQCWAVAHYLRLIVWPKALTLDYGTELVTGLRGVPGLVLLLALAAATVAAWTRVRRLGWFAFAGAWFFLLLAPSSSVVPIPTEIAAERRAYLAMLPVVALVVVAAELMRRRFAPAVSFKRSVWALMGIAGGGGSS